MRQEHLHGDNYIYLIVLFLDLNGYFKYAPYNSQWYIVSTQKVLSTRIVATVVITITIAETHNSSETGNSVIIRYD